MSDIRSRLYHLASQENTVDRACDAHDLRVMMDLAIYAKDDVTVIETVLQLPLDGCSLQEAIRSMQNELKALNLRNGELATTLPVDIPRRGITAPASEGPAPFQGLPPDSNAEQDILADLPVHRQFIKTCIDALRRISGTDDSVLPDWTISYFEVEFGDQIGFGSTSSVYEGIWKNSIVAIKEVKSSAADECEKARLRFKQEVSFPGLD